jgi:hypothetical protein
MGDAMTKAELLRREKRMVEIFILPVSYCVLWYSVESRSLFFLFFPCRYQRPGKGYVRAENSQCYSNCFISCHSLL